MGEGREGREGRERKAFSTFDEWCCGKGVLDDVETAFRIHAFPNR
jgi:hypothetical protein